MIDKNCIATFHNHIFDPTAPDASDLCIEDIAHALSMLTRANGHFAAFYSVARHSLNCAYEAAARGYDDRIQLFALLHDGAESYIGDLTRPLRRHIPEFSAIEQRLQKLIFEKFATTEVSEAEQAAVKAIDDSLLYHEFYRFHGAQLFDAPPELHIALEADLSPAESEAEFLALYNKLHDRL